MITRDDLKAVGIGKGITETISTTKGLRFNAAPVGLVNREAIYVEIFRGSHTYKNLMESGEIGINLVYDPVLFVESIFGDLNDDDYYTIDGFPFIKKASAVLKFAVTRIEEKELSSRFFLRLVFKKIRDRKIRGINRGFNLLLELAILSSRREITDEYNKMYPIYSPIIRRCGDERTIEALEDMMRKIKDKK